MKKLLKKRYDNLVNQLNESDNTKIWNNALKKAEGNYDNALFYLHCQLEYNIDCINPEYIDSLNRLNLYFYAMDILEEIMYKNDSFKKFI